MALFLKPHGSSISEKFLRFVGMIVILGIVAWAFWMNNQSTLEKIQARNALWDQTKVLSQAERDFVQGFIRSMRNEYGVKVRIQITDEHIKDSELEQNELFIALSPPYEEVGMHFPGLVKHALGANFVSELKTDHFKNSFNADKWPTALITALSMIWDRLSKVESQQKVAPVYGDDGSGNSNYTDPESAGYKE